MIALKQRTAALLAERIAAEFPGATLTADELFAMFEYPPDANMGDLALPCFKLSKSLRRAPAMIATALAGAFEGNTLYANSQELRRGRTAVYYETSVTDDTGALIARVTASGQVLA